LVVSSNNLSRVSFDFLCYNQLIRLPLEEHIREKDESIIDIEYIEKFQASEPEDALMHDDCVSVCRSLGDTILVGSYHTKVHLWNNQEVVLNFIQMRSTTNKTKTTDKKKTFEGYLE
jgi:hypothetical protein